jgi:hypothetical protein
MFPVPVMSTNKDDYTGLPVWSFAMSDALETIDWYHSNRTENGLSNEKLAELANAHWKKQVMHAMKKTHDDLGWTGLEEFMSVVEKQSVAAHVIEMAFEHLIRVRANPAAEHVPEWHLLEPVIGAVYTAISNYADRPVRYSQLMEFWEMAIQLKYMSEAYLRSAAAIEDPDRKARHEERGRRFAGQLEMLLENHSALFEAIRAAGGVF